MPAKKRTGHTDRKPTRYRGVYYRGSDSEREYCVTWRCHGLCDNPKHIAKGAGQHWERAYGEAGDACKLLAEREQEVEDRRARLQRGEQVKPDRTFDEVLVEYKDSEAWRRLVPGTQDKYYRDLVRHVRPTFGRLLVRDITKAKLKAWLTDLRRAERKRRRGDRTHGLSESSINGALTALRVVLRFAHKEAEYIESNPADELPPSVLPRTEEDKRETQVLSEDELDRLLASAGDGDRLPLKLVAFTGLRSAELRGLVWSDLDLDRGVVIVTRQIDHRDTGTRVPLKSKMLTDRRIVPLMTELMDELRDHKAKLSEHDRAKPSDWVFCEAHGSHVPHGRLAGQFDAAVSRAGIERDPDKRLSPHSLRHGFGSMMLAFGHPLKTVSNWLGHTKVGTTERWYAHELDAMQDEASGRMRAQMDARRAKRAEAAVPR